jgi:AmiR/NasT family two-component response regulator
MLGKSSAKKPLPVANAKKEQSQGMKDILASGKKRVEERRRIKKAKKAQKNAPKSYA